MTEEIRSFRPKNQYCTVYYKIIDEGTDQVKTKVIDVVFDFVDNIDYQPIPTKNQTNLKKE